MRTCIRVGILLLGASLSVGLWADSADEALALAERTLVYVAKSVDAATLKPYARELALDAKWLKGETLPGYRAGIGREIARLRRRILFLHPDLQFEKLLCVQRGIPYHHDPHMVDQYVGRHSRPGPGLVVLENWRNVPRKTVLLKDKLPVGTVLNPDLHWDADRILFAFCDHTDKPKVDPEKLRINADVKAAHFTPWMRQADPTSPLHRGDEGERAVAHHRYFIYECAADGSWLRQITGTPDDPMTTRKGRQTVMIEDADPCYLPDGGFVFISTRGQNFGRCHWGRWTPSFLLYRGELPPVGTLRGADRIRQLSFGEANEWEPTVLDDGRIGYTRWDYINRNAVWHQSLWTIRPDGTGVSHLYGNYSENVCVGTELKTIPGSSLLVATASAHHNLTSGSLFLLDPMKGEDGLDPIIRLTPEAPFPESEDWKLGGTFCSPMAVNDTLFFCAYSDEPLSFPPGHPRHQPKSCGATWPTQGAYGIYLVDRLGGRELIFKDPAISTFNPIPLVKRHRPPALASVLPTAETAPTSGVCYVENVYDTRTDLPKGSVKALRINRLINLPICRRRTLNAGRDLDLYKESLGTVPVNPDGSVAFRMPAEEPIQLQALDADGKAILTMRSFIFAQKGEIQGCAGCHENKSAAAPAADAGRSRRGQVHDPVPEVELGYAGPFSFTKSIQPIFDAKCIACHGLEGAVGDTPRRVSLIGPEAQSNLIQAKQVSCIHSYEETHISKCYDYFAGASPLMKRLKAGHGPALTDEEWRKLILWLDFNVPFYARGTGYGWNEPDCREIDPKGEAELRSAIREKLGEKVAQQPFDALVNRGDERLSRVLMLLGGEKSPDYARFLSLCTGALIPIPWRDIDGTCGRDDKCECRSCWVRRAGYNKPGGGESPR